MNRVTLHTLVLGLLTVTVLAQDAAFDIAYAKKGEIWLAQSRGEKREHVTTVDPGWDRYVCWSPDGKTLLVPIHDAGWNIWAVDLATRKRKKLTANGDNRSPSYSPDGKLIAYMRGGDGVWVMNADGTNRRRLTKKGHRDVVPCWSPDGKRLVYDHLARSGEHSVRSEARIVDLDGRNDRVLGTSTGSISEACWSPDGKTVLASASRKGNREIIAFEVDGDGERNLTRSAEAEDLYASWSPDGKRFTWLSRTEEERALWVANADGSAPKRLTAIAGRTHVPRWSPDGEDILYVQENAEPKRYDLWVIASTGGEPRLVAEGVLCATWRPAPRRE